MESTERAPLSADARRQLETELAQLRQQRAATAPGLGELGGPGDSADQADVLERAEVAAWLDRRIAEVTDILARGYPVESGFADGTKITLRFDDGSEDTLRIVAVAGGEGGGSSVTADSPLGQALQGHKAGDTITYRTPGGQLSATVVSIKPPK
ncbi:GreA/GreB family elongation factor [Amycolatopsis anabasis]|uniref:GreA/GreB family elongation factor n=1 Tax=Amycolatopsis anabasis TaxID=1840409 RepID=UPI00131DD892|nr:GreA/GreB family elongation factor [Amycolatopsis anabasis]